MNSAASAAPSAVVAMKSSGVVANCAHTKSGMRVKVIPGARILYIVTRKLIPVIVELIPIRKTATHHRFVPGGPWSEIGGYSVQGPPGTNLWCVAVFLIGISSTMTGINFLVTMYKMRAPGMTFTRMPLFVWAQFATTPLLFIATTALGAALAALFIERVFGVPFYDPKRGGSPVLWQHMFWFHSHPAVYIMIIPGFGIISEVLPTFARKPIFGYKMIAVSSVAISLLSFSVWAHH